MKNPTITLTLPGGVQLRTRAGVEGLILDDNIGVPVLREWIVTIDMAHQKL